METELGKHGAFIDGLYICPHHTDKGFEGERPDYKFDCDCRKPKTGLFMQANRDFHIDFSQSYMVGDSGLDIQAGYAAGCKDSIKVEKNREGALMEAMKKVLL
jgi:D-glycero-D-manno-heptose 1,7-bisphosphate phosphatase